MVLQRFPGANLIGQFIKQITEPLSKRIVKRVKKWPLVRKHVLIRLGIFYYWCDYKLKRQQIPIAVKRKLVDDVHTMELGTKLLLEILIFGLLWGAILYETSKAVEQSRIVEQLKVEEFNDLEAEKDWLMQRVKDQVILTKRLKDIIMEYSRQVECTLLNDPEKKEE